jgi:glycosyltransferase involved in cell wall biosynthesis
MRIAHFVQRYPPALGGSEAYFARLSRFLACRGHQVTVFTTTALDLSAFWSTGGRCLRPGESWDAGVRVRRFPLWHLPYQTRVLKALSFLPHRPWQCLTLSCNPISWPMWQAAGRSEPFDLVHATAFPYGWPLACARKLARRLKVPFLLTPFVHLGDLDDPRDRTRKVYTSGALLSLARCADRLFVQTEGERQAFLDLGFPAHQVILQGMGLDLPSCTGGQRQQARQQWGIRPGEVVVGHLANQSREKGSVDLLRALQRAWARGSQLRVVLAGPEMPNFQSFWRTYRAQARVVRLGVVDANQKRDFFAGIDLFALPSRSDSFGLVLLEAWANGIPNVGYRAGGIPWVIQEGKDGLLVRCGDVTGLAGALVTLERNPTLRQQLGQAGRQRTRHEFVWEDKLEVVESVQEELTAEAQIG